MSPPSSPPAWRAQCARWLRRAAAAIAGGAFDALVGSLGARSVAVAVLALVVAGGAAWAATRVSREDVSGDRVSARMDRRAKPDTQDAVKRVLAAAAAERQAKLDQQSQSLTETTGRVKKVASAGR
jgi:hypothetical protein